MAVNKKPIGVNFEKLLQSLQGNVHEMKLEFDESRLPINDDNKHLHQFCDRVEFVLKFGLKERGSVLGGRKDLWQYFCKCLAERRNIHDGLKLVKANTELKTSVGRSRCFLRYCLVHQCMGDVIQQCLDNHAVTRQFYQDGALMLDQKLCPALLNILYQLCDVSFDLPPTGHDLDVSWPTYARHGGGVWRPPTRTVSLSSLCSYTSQLSEAVTSQLGNTPSMASVSEDNQSPDCNHSPSHGIAHANMEASQDMTTMQERLALLEEDNASLRASCASLQHKLDQAQQYSTVDTSPTTVDPDNSDTSITYNKCCQCEQLSEELRISKDKCTELQHLHQLLEKEVKTLLAQVDNFQTQENDLKSELKKLEQKLQDTVSAGERLSTGVHELLKETDPPAVPRMDMATITHEQCAVSKPTNAILLPDIESSLDPQEVLDQYRHKLENLEKENKALQEQCHAAEMEKNTLRTNIRKISEAEEKLKQKVASLSQQEKKYESLEEEVDILKDRYEERGRLLHIATDRVKELETSLHASEATAKDTLTQLNQANVEVTRMQTIHNDMNCKYEQLKTEVHTLQQQVADLRFQVSSKDMEHAAAVKADLEKSEALTAAASQISEQEAKITQLEEDALSQKQLLLTEQDRLTSQVNELTQNLLERDNQCSCLNDRLQQAEATLKVTQQNLSKLQAQLHTTKEASFQLSDDNGHLREKIIQLLREKDALWQANVRLEGAAGCGRAWMDNSSAQKCLGCNVSFSITRRRHHCRTCGRIFCTGCSDNWIMTPASSRRVRVCDDCFSVQAELATLVSSPSSYTNSGLDGSLLEGKLSTIQTPNTTHPLPTDSQQTDCDEYAVISDDEVQSSRLSSSPSSGSPPSNSDVITETRATEDVLTIDTLSTSPPTNAEVWVGAGTRVMVPINLPTGVTLHWNFVSEPKNVSFAVLHQPHVESPERSVGDDNPAACEQRILIPTTRVASTQGAAVRGRLDTKQSGIYTLVFDNSTSRFTARKVTYSMSLKKPVSSEAEAVSPPLTSSQTPTSLPASLPVS